MVRILEQIPSYQGVSIRVHGVIPFLVSDKIPFMASGWLLSTQKKSVEKNDSNPWTDSIAGYFIFVSMECLVCEEIQFLTFGSIMFTDENTCSQNSLPKPLDWFHPSCVEYFCFIFLEALHFISKEPVPNLWMEIRSKSLEGLYYKFLESFNFESQEKFCFSWINFLIFGGYSLIIFARILFHFCWEFLLRMFG